MTGEAAAAGIMDIVWQTPATPAKAEDYIFRNGIRHVRPYYFEFVSHAKNRWEGKNIIDLFAYEFRGRPREYYVDAVKYGRIQVNGQTVDASYVVRSSEKITHFVHRHEPPVMASDVLVLHKDDDVLTVCKPPSVPVHPSGQYRKNTVVGILQAEHNMFPLFPVHRLDRLVSGLLIIARNADKADRFRQQIVAGLVHKEYIARVSGVFPEEEVVVDMNVDFDAREGRSSVEANEKLSDRPARGKTACTRFTRICTNGFQSLVFCRPITGRTHQIRVHLQHTGHPIANDSLYLPTSSPTEKSTIYYRDGVSSLPQPTSETCFSGDFQLDFKDMQSKDGFLIDPMCTNCPHLVPKGYEEIEEGLWLHCIRYSGPDWSYECPHPDWATEMLGKKKAGLSTH